MRWPSAHFSFFWASTCNYSNVHSIPHCLVLFENISEGDAWVKTVNRLKATIKCTGESAFRAYWISQSRKPIASVDFLNFFQKIQYARKLVRTRSELYELPEDLLYYLSSAFWEKKKLGQRVELCIPWMGGRAMYVFQYFLNNRRWYAALNN